MVKTIKRILTIVCVLVWLILIWDAVYPESLPWLDESKTEAAFVLSLAICVYCYPYKYWEDKDDY